MRRDAIKERKRGKKKQPNEINLRKFSAGPFTGAIRRHFDLGPGWVFYWLLPGFYRVFTEFWNVVLIFNGFHWVSSCIRSYFCFNRSYLGLTVFYLVLLGCYPVLRFSYILPSFTGCCRVVPSFTGFC